MSAIVIRNTAALILLIGTGLVHGAWTNRWNSSQAITGMGAKFDLIPMEIGEWKGTSFELSPRELAMTGATAHFARRYANASLGVSVSVLLLGGLPGDISSHTPDVCYPGAGYTLNQPLPFECRYGPDQRKASFWTGLATRGGTSPSTLRLFWAWNASHGWSAPNNPRWSFVSEPALCKLYVIRETSGMAIAPGDDPSNKFLDAFLAQVDRNVFAPL